MAAPTEYRLWKHMRSRCNNPNDPVYSRYGGRGIKVSGRWSTYKQFALDMGARPAGTTLDRIDNDRNYEPSNCRWATAKEQANNKRNNRVILIDGVSKTLAQWIEEAGLKSSTVRQRFYVYGWDIKRALTTPSRSRRIANWQ